MKLNLRTIALFASVLAGSAFLSAGILLVDWRNAQIDAYNDGIRMLANGDADAQNAFAQSLIHYERMYRRSWGERFVFPSPDRELAARAAFMRGLALQQARQQEAAVSAFLLSLRLNPGSVGGGSAEDARRRDELALLVKYNLELLFNARPDLANQQGVGRQGQGQGEPQRVPGQNPGNLPGPGNRDDL